MPTGIELKNTPCVRCNELNLEEWGEEEVHIQNGDYICPQCFQQLKEKGIA